MWIFYSLSNIIVASLADLIHIKLIKSLKAQLFYFSNLITLPITIIYFALINEPIHLSINYWTVLSILSNVLATYILLNQMKTKTLNSVALSYGSRIVFTTLISIIYIGIPIKSVPITIIASFLIILSIFINNPEYNTLNYKRLILGIFIPQLLYSLYATFGKFAMLTTTPSNFTFSLLFGITIGSLFLYIHDSYLHKNANSKNKHKQISPKDLLLKLLPLLLLNGLLCFMAFLTISLAIQQGNLAYVTAIQMSRGNLLSMFDVVHNKTGKLKEKVHIYLLNLTGILLITL